MMLAVRAIEVRSVMTGNGERWVVECYEDGRVVARIAFPTRSCAVTYARDMARWTDTVLCGKVTILPTHHSMGPRGTSGAA